MKEHKASPSPSKSSPSPETGKSSAVSSNSNAPPAGEKTKAVESLNSLVLQNALNELFEESRLHSSIHVAN